MKNSFTFEGSIVKLDDGETGIMKSLEQLSDFVVTLRKMNSHGLTMIGTEFCADKLEKLFKEVIDEITLKISSAENKYADRN